MLFRSHIRTPQVPHPPPDCPNATCKPWGPPPRCIAGPSPRATASLTRTPRHGSQLAPRRPWPPHPPMLQIQPSLTSSTSVIRQGRGRGSIYLPACTVSVYPRARVLVRSGDDQKEEEEIHGWGYIQRPRHHPDVVLEARIHCLLNLC